MMFYKSRKLHSPKEGQLCLVKCPEWSDTGFEVAYYEYGQFRSDNNGDDLDRYVIQWMPLNEKGEPIP